MARAEPGSAKYVANKIKARGLQRLRWYCQICRKQCRDDNGFKCHTESESHIRNALQLKHDPSKVDKFSRQFQNEFLYLLRASHGTKTVSANKVYGQYIQNKDHLHMNATRWKSLGSFLRSLEHQGLVKVDQDEFGLTVAYLGKKVEEAPKAVEKDEIRLQMERAGVLGSAVSTPMPEATETATSPEPEPKVELVTKLSSAPDPGSLEEQIKQEPEPNSPKAEPAPEVEQPAISFKLPKKKSGARVNPL